MLVLFRPSNKTYHLVTEVSPYADSKRLAVTGWWTLREPIPLPKPLQSDWYFGPRPRALAKGVFVFGERAED